MKHTATIQIDLKGKDLENRATIASLMMMITQSLERWPLPNITHWELVSFTKAK